MFRINKEDFILVLKVNKKNVVPKVLFIYNFFAAVYYSDWSLCYALCGLFYFIKPLINTKI